VKVCQTENPFIPPIPPACQLHLEAIVKIRNQRRRDEQPFVCLTAQLYRLQIAKKEGSLAPLNGV
jgi:hypothetical protein